MSVPDIAKKDRRTIGGNIVRQSRTSHGHGIKTRSTFGGKMYVSTEKRLGTIGHSKAIGP